MVALVAFLNSTMTAVSDNTPFEFRLPVYDTGINMRIWFGYFWLDSCRQRVRAGEFTVTGTVPQTGCVDIFTALDTLQKIRRLLERPKHHHFVRVRLRRVWYRIGPGPKPFVTVLNFFQEWLGTLVILQGLKCIVNKFLGGRWWRELACLVQCE